MTGPSVAPSADPQAALLASHGPDVCGKTPCAVCWAPGGLALNEKGECRTACAFGTCGGGGYTACGGCCGCLGGCQVQWENAQAGASSEKTAAQAAPEAAS